MIAYKLWILCAVMTSAGCIPELKLLHVIFGHKTYAPISELINNNETTFPSNLTYEHFNSAILGIPNAGMLNMYNLGVYLRETYGRFLGDIYTNQIMKMRTTECSLSKLSGQLVNAGLWPPSESQKWSDDIDWQPIPADYLPLKQDALLLGIHCPSFIVETNRILKTEETRKLMLQHLPLLDYLSRYTKMKIDRPSKVALLYSTLETKADLNQTLPNWAEDIFPHGEMYNLTLQEYDLLSQTLIQKQLNGGSLIKEILSNSLKHIHGILPKGRKLMIYGGNERNIVGILKNLNLWSPHIPNEGAAVIFETYFDNETQGHTLKINYYTGIEGDTFPLRVPHCTEMCPLETFINLVYDVIPENEEILCIQRIPCSLENEVNLDFTTQSRSISFAPRNITFLILIFVFFVY